MLAVGWLCDQSAGAQCRCCTAAVGCEALLSWPTADAVCLVGTAGQTGPGGHAGCSAGHANAPAACMCSLLSRLSCVCVVGSFCVGLAAAARMCGQQNAGARPGGCARLGLDHLSVGYDPVLAIGWGMLPAAEPGWLCSCGLGRSACDPSHS
ncbi:hypothetical protein COO60DRAFT_915087 [Scenedesmus sp. NREL 46B-D3]|nr:hypothetical protein COO60DRAFT_915087 [Scenedesmus sp. NREL 46B-D3]